MPDQDQALIPYEPEIPRWEFWRQKGACRLWVAVLLTLNIEPTVQNRNELAERLPDRYAEFTNRRAIMRTQYGLHPLLPTIKHPGAGTKRGEQFVLLEDVLNFAKDIGWRDMGPMEEGLTHQAVYSTSGNLVEVTNELSDLPKGEQYNLIRMGALLKILEKYLQPAEELNKGKLLIGKTINLSALGKEMQAVIAEAARKKNTDTIRLFTEDTNRKQLGAAAKALAKFF